MRRHMRILGTLRYLAVFVLVLAFASCGGMLQDKGAVSAPDVSARQQLLLKVLADELAKQGVDLSRTASSPPTGDCNKPQGLEIAPDGIGGWELTWPFCNHGDYNQDGKVDVSDITPIAVHFGESNQTIGGDGSAAVGVGDVTPIAQHFGTELAGYLIETAPETTGPYSELARVPLGELKAEAGTLIAHLPLSLLDDSYYRVTPSDASEALGIASDPYTRAFGSPVIASVMPISATIDTAVSMQAEVTGEGLRTYAWAFGTGSLPIASSEESPSVIFSQAGQIQCSLTVTTVFGSDNYDFTVSVTDPGAMPYITNIQPQSSLAGVPITFGAEAGGQDPLTYSWSFTGGEPTVSNLVNPEVTFASAGQHSVSLTVANASGSADYNFNMTIIAGLDIELVAIRINVDGAVNTLETSIYKGRPLFTAPLSGSAQGSALTLANLHGVLDSINYYYPPGDTPYGFEDPAPEGKDAEYEATLDYLKTKVEWNISLTGHLESDLFTHDPGELPGELFGQLGAIGDTYTLQAVIPAGVLDFTDPVEVVVDLSVVPPV
jgi:PKD repeat protein